MEHRGEIRPLSGPPTSPPSPRAARVARGADHLALAAFFAWVTATSVRRIASADIWWHLAFGRYVWAHRALPSTDAFTFTAGGQPWVNVSWFADLLLYGIHTLGGVPALAATTTMLIVAATAAMAWGGHRAGRSVAFIPAAALALMLHRPRFVLRPFLLSALFTALAVGLIEHERRRYVREPDSRSRLLWWLVPLAWVWASSHGAFVILFGLLGAYGLELLVQARPRDADDPEARARWRRRFRQALLVGAVCLLATLAQPYGPRAYWRVAVLLRQSGVYAQIIGEWQSTLAYAARDPVLALRLSLFAGLLVASFLAVRRRPSLFRSLVVAGLGALAVSAVRHLDVFLYAAVPVIAANFNDAWTARRGQTRPAGAASATLACAWLGAVATLGGVAAYHHLQPRVLVDGQVERARTWAIEPLAYPGAAVDRLLQEPTGGRVFNTFENGGYLFWRQFPEPVFIDSKGLDEQQILDWMAMRDDPGLLAEAIAHYDLRAAVLNPLPQYARLYRWFAGRPEWRLEIMSAQGILFTRRTAPKAAGPVMGDPGADLPAFEPPSLPPVDLRAPPRAPRPAAAQSLGRFWTAAAMPRRAAAAYAAGLAQSPHYLPLRLTYARALADLGHPGPALAAVAGLDAVRDVTLQARLALVRALAARAAGDLHGALAQADRVGGGRLLEEGHQLRLQLQLELGNTDAAVAEGEAWLRARPDSVAARNDLAVALASRGDTARALALVDEAIAMAPARGDLHHTRGLILQRAGDAAAAADAFARARALGHVR